MSPTDQPSRYDAVLLDIDGTLFDSNGAHASAWSDAFAIHGKDYPAEQIRPDRQGRRQGAVGTGVHRSRIGRGEGDRQGARQNLKDRYLPTVKATPGAKDFVQWLIDSRLKVVIATSAKNDEIKDLLTICDGQALQGD